MKMEDLEKITVDDMLNWETTSYYGATVYDDFYQILQMKVQDNDLRMALRKGIMCRRSFKLFYVFTIMNEPICLLAAHEANVNIIGKQMSFKWLL